MRFSLVIIVLVILGACSQKSINNASYSAGQTTKEVVDGVTTAYHKTVESSQEAWESAEEGYSGADSEKEESVEEEAKSELEQEEEYY